MGVSEWDFLIMVAKDYLDNCVAIIFATISMGWFESGV